jgi:hypothetical protein
MTLRLILTLGIAVVLTSTGCRKEEPQVVTGDPVFYVNGTLNGSPLLLRAGVADYYMYSEYSADQQNLYSFSGHLKTEGSSNPSSSSLRISITDSRYSAPGPALIDSALFTGTYPFVQNQLPLLSIMFSASAYGDSILNYTWDFGDGNFGSGANTIHTYNNAGTYNVCLYTSFLHNNIPQEDTICNMINVGNTNACSSEFTYANIIGNNFQFDATASGGTAPYQFNWDFGDTANATGSSITHTFTQPPNDGIVTVKLTSTDANSCVFITQQNIPLPSATGCYANFTAQAINMSQLFSNVTVEWTDANGITYSSANGVGLNNLFQVLSVEDYENNENGQRTKKIKMRVTCTMFNGSNTVQLDNAEIIFALAYP